MFRDVCWHRLPHHRSTWKWWCCARFVSPSHSRRRTSHSKQASQQKEKWHVESWRMKGILRLPSFATGRAVLATLHSIQTELDATLMGQACMSWLLEAPTEKQGKRHRPGYYESTAVCCCCSSGVSPKTPGHGVCALTRQGRRRAGGVRASAGPSPTTQPSVPTGTHKGVQGPVLGPVTPLPVVVFVNNTGGPCPPAPPHPPPRPRTVAEPLWGEGLGQGALAGWMDPAGQTVSGTGEGGAPHY